MRQTDTWYRLTETFCWLLQYKTNQICINILKVLLRFQQQKFRGRRAVPFKDIAQAETRNLKSRVFALQSGYFQSGFCTPIIREVFTRAAGTSKYRVYDEEVGSGKALDAKFYFYNWRYHTNVRGVPQP
jgi:hypothetical protein